MQELQLYEYAVIRVVPRVEREEFINVGIILFCKKTGYVNCRIFVNEQKLYCMGSDTDVSIIYKNLDAFVMVANGNKESKSPIALLDAPSRFRWLTATRSTVIQCSKVHPGLTNDLTAAIEKLMLELVN